MSKDMLPLCLAWRRLLQEQTLPYHPLFDALIQAGHAHRRSTRVVLDDARAVTDLVTTHCRQAFTTQAQAQEAAARLGLEVDIEARPQECLHLLQALPGLSGGEPGMIQQVSSALFQDSKHLGRTRVLGRIWEAWLEKQPTAGDLRLKAFSRIVHEPSGLDLFQITQAFGSVLLDGKAAAQPGAFSLSGLPRVVTCENLAPFRQLHLDQGLLLYSKGYASRTVGGWLAALPQACTWTHFGDLDADGLFIFEDLMHKSGRQGHFVPDPRDVAALLPQGSSWSGSRTLEGDKYKTPEVAGMARRARDLGVEVEQETVLAQCRQRGRPLSVIGLRGAWVGSGGGAL